MTERPRRIAQANSFPLKKLLKFKKVGALTSGFTIVELLVATAVFSLILMGAVGAFLGIGRLFYKGIVNTQTQTTAKKTLDSITADMQNSSTLTNQATSGGYTYFCAGNVRYTLNFDKMVDLANPDYSPTNGNFGILRDVLPGSTACAPPCESAPCASPAVAFIQPKELLGNRMRLDNLTIGTVAAQADTYSVKVRIAFGDDESLLKIIDPPSPTTDDYECNSNSARSQFCALASVSNVVFAGGF